MRPRDLRALPGEMAADAPARRLPVLQGANRPRREERRGGKFFSRLFCVFVHVYRRFICFFKRFFLNLIEPFKKKLFDIFFFHIFFQKLAKRALKALNTHTKKHETHIAKNIKAKAINPKKMMNRNSVIIFNDRALMRQSFGKIFFFCIWSRRRKVNQQ